MLVLIASLAFIIMIIFSYLALGSYISERETMALRLKALDRPQELGSVIEEEMAPSLKERLVTPFFNNISRFFSQLLPSSVISSLEKKLIMAGGFYGLNAEQFLGLCGVISVLLTVIVLEFSVVSNQPINKIIGFCMISLILGAALPLLLLKQRTITRKENLQRELPDVLDLLTVSVEAGLGFDGALVKLSEKMSGDMVDEFNRMLQEMRIGVPRREALRALAKRCDVQDVTLFTGALVQADQLGVSIGKVLRIQSVEMREKRRQRAEEQAMKAPIKMLFPLVFFIFPVIFIVLLGPAVLQVMKLFTNK